MLLVFRLICPALALRKNRFDYYFKAVCFLFRERLFQNIDITDSQQCAQGLLQNRQITNVVYKGV